MKKVIALSLLVVLFFLALSPEWSILALGKALSESSFAVYIIQGLAVMISIIAIIFIFFNLPLDIGKKKKNLNE